MKKPFTHTELDSAVRCKCGKPIKKNVVARKITPPICYQCAMKIQKAKRSKRN